MFGVLVPVGGGDLIPLEKRELVVGRKDGCDIVLRFDNVSGRHCRLVLSAGYWYVVDLNSSNGVKVNDVRTKDQRIDPGNKLSIAKHEFTLKYDPSKNGASGEKPPIMFQEAEIMSQSLLEKIGLQKPKQNNTDNKKTFDQLNNLNDHSNEEENEDNNSTIQTEEPHVKKNYYEKLKFD
jgi:adenylate cyclase